MLMCRGHQSVLRCGLSNIFSAAKAPALLHIARWSPLVACVFPTFFTPFCKALQCAGRLVATPDFLPKLSEAIKSNLIKSSASTGLPAQDSQHCFSSQFRLQQIHKCAAVTPLQEAEWFELDSHLGTPSECHDCAGKKKTSSEVILSSSTPRHSPYISLSLVRSFSWAFLPGLIWLWKSVTISDSPWRSVTICSATPAADLSILRYSKSLWHCSDSSQVQHLRVQPQQAQAPAPRVPYPLPWRQTTPMALHRIKVHVHSTTISP